MRIGDRHFTPGFWPSLATLILFPVFVALGFWQLDRADQKTRKHEMFLRQQSAPAMDLPAPDTLHQDKSELLWRHVRIRGGFDTHMHILLDNQVKKGAAGYLVFTPFRVDGGAWLLVNRGWIPLGADRSTVPALDAPAGNVMIEGIINDPPPGGLVLGESIPEKLSQTIYRAQRISLEEVAGLSGHELLPYVLLLGPESGYGFVREWQMPGSGREINLGYAFQWFLFAGLLLVIYIIVNTKKTGHADT